MTRRSTQVGVLAAGACATLFVAAGCGAGTHSANDPSTSPSQANQASSQDANSAAKSDPCRHRSVKPDRTAPVDIDADVERIIREQLDVTAAQITRGARLIEDLGATSLRLVELVLALEATFEIDIPDEDAAKFETVEDIVVYVRAPRATPSPSGAQK